MKKILSFLVIAIFIFGTVPFTSSANSTSPERYIVKYNHKVTDKDVAKLKNRGLEIVEKLNSINAVVVKSNTESISSVSNDSDIVRIDKDQKYTMASFPQRDLWNMHTVNATKAWPEGITGKGVKIAILDTGVDLSHPDLKIYSAVSVVNGETSDDVFGHGTHVAGIIAAQNNDFGVEGVAPDALIYAIKVFQDQGNGFAYTSDIVKGVQYAMDNHVDIISMSLGGASSDPDFKEILDKAYQSGIVIVAAAGNDGNFDDDVSYPAKYDSVIAVSATDDKNKLANYSSIGKEVEVSDPGSYILSTYKNDGYTFLSGTSMATPHVAGLLALYKQKYPNLSNKELRQLLDNNALDLGNKGRDIKFGYGLAQFSNQYYKDVPENFWAFNSIMYSTEKNWFNGYNWYFRPNDNIKRSEIATVFDKALKLQDYNMPNYSDVPDSYWAKNVIENMHYYHFMNGYPDNTFKPENSLTRAEVATIIYNALHDKQQPSGKDKNYSDVSKDYWAYNTIHYVTKLGIFNGYADNSFRPDTPITRAEMAAVMLKIDNNTTLFK